MGLLPSRRLREKDRSFHQVAGQVPDVPRCFCRPLCRPGGHPRRGRQNHLRHVSQLPVAAAETGGALFHLCRRHHAPARRPGLQSPAPGHLPDRKNPLRPRRPAAGGGGTSFFLHEPMVRPRAANGARSPPRADHHHPADHRHGLLEPAIRGEKGGAVPGGICGRGFHAQGRRCIDGSGGDAGICPSGMASGDQESAGNQGGEHHLLYRIQRGCPRLARSGPVL